MILLIVRRKVHYIVWLLVLNSLSETTGKQIPCESKGVGPWEFTDDRKTCFMKSSSRIDSNYTTIETDATIDALTFDGNDKISFLPVEVEISFPFLTIYSASRCSVRTIAKDNFKNLRRLRYLQIDNNRIEEIRSDTFRDLTSLEKLFLSEQRFYF